MVALVVGLCVVGGLAASDVLEVMVERTGEHRDLRLPWWACPSCRQPAAVAERWPLVGPLRRRRSCPRCGEDRQRSLRPILLGVVAAGASAILVVRVGLHPVVLAWLAATVGLEVMAAVDLERLIIPNRVLYPTGLAVAGLLVVASAAGDRWDDLGWAVASAAVAGAVFFLVHAAVPHGMGFGDVRLAAVVGLAVGWASPSRAFVAFLLAFVIGAVGGVVVMVVTGQGRRAKVPFGPFLAIGAYGAFVAGGPLARLIFHHG